MINDTYHEPSIERDIRGFGNDLEVVYHLYLTSGSIYGRLFSVEVSTAHRVHKGKDEGKSEGVYYPDEAEHRKLQQREGCSPSPLIGARGFQETCRLACGHIGG